MITLSNVSVKRGGVVLLEAIDLRINKQRVALIGGNGSGKSTFARLLNGLILPEQGSVSVLGNDSRHDRDQLRRQVGFVFQNPDVQFVFSVVVEDMMFGLRNLGLADEQAEMRVDEILGRFDLSHLKARQVHTLSGGEKQLICLAAVLVMQPSLVVLDEPTTLLDLAHTLKINQHLMSLAQPVVIATHDLTLASQCDEVVWLDQRRVRMQGEPSEVISAYRHAVTGVSA